MELRLTPLDSIQSIARATQALTKTSAVQGKGFQDALTDALQATSALQKESGRLTKEFTLDNPTVSLEEAMIGEVPCKAWQLADARDPQIVVQIFGAPVGFDKPHITAEVLEEGGFLDAVARIPDHTNPLARVFVAVAHGAVTQQVGGLDGIGAWQRRQPVLHASAKQNVARPQQLVRQADREQTIGSAFDVTDRVEDHMSADLPQMPLHPVQQLNARHAVRKARDVVRARDAPGAACAGVDDAHKAVKPAQIQTGGQSCGSTADHHAVEDFAATGFGAGEHVLGVDHGHW